jgi:hypothetical protein
MNGTAKAEAAPGPRTMTLRAPVEAYDDTVKVLTFRKPNGGDLASCGMPFAMTREELTDEAGAKINTMAVRKLISRLCKIPTDAVDQLDVRDWRDACVIVCDFFVEPEKESKKDSSTSGSSSAAPMP